MDRRKEKARARKLFKNGFEFRSDGDAGGFCITLQLLTVVDEDVGIPINIKNRQVGSITLGSPGFV